METKLLIVSIFSFASINGYVVNYDDEDIILGMLISDDYIPNAPNLSEEIPKYREQKPIFVNGVWLCGNCSDISEVNLLYYESYDVKTTFDKDMELQIGFSLDNMRCIKINTDENAEVKSVSGACTRNAVTLKVMNTNRCDFWIYS